MQQALCFHPDSFVGCAGALAFLCALLTFQMDFVNHADDSGVVSFGQNARESLFALLAVVNPESGIIAAGTNQDPDICFAEKTTQQRIAAVDGQIDS